MARRRSKVTAALLAGTLALGVLPFTPGEDVASAVSRGSILEVTRDPGYEARYVTRMLEILDEGIANRVNLDLALRARRTAKEYEALFDDFRLRQQALLLNLQEVGTPPRFVAFDERLRAAIVTQAAFYAAFVRAKIRDASVEVDGMLDHPAFRASSLEFEAAREHVRRLKPALDRATEAAIADRLCWLDTI